MGKYTVELYDRGFAVAPPTTLDLTVLRYSANAVGGYEQCEIAVAGSNIRLWEALQWLRYYVVIRNQNHNAVWAGYVAQAEINLGGLQRGKTLDGMANKIAVAYSTTDASGNSMSGKTDYADDTESQARYGIIELLQNQGEADQATAENLRQIALARLKYPTSTPGTVSYGSEEGGTLICRGLWGTLDWRLWNQPAGVVRYEDTGDHEHLLGYGFTSNQVGFKHNLASINDMGGNLGGLRTDDQVVVSGAANSGNNGTVTVKSASTVDFAHDTHTYTSTSIRFEPADDILDTNDGFGFVQAGQLLNISGSSVSGNNGYHWARGDLANDHITVSPQTISTSGAGPSVTVAQGQSITTSGTLTDEFPGATVTVTALGVYVAQSFTLPVNAPFLIAEVYIRAKKVGAPTDNLTVYIETDNGSGAPSGTVIESVSIAGSTLNEDMNWLKFTFAGLNSLAYGVTYWLVIARSGANSPTDYYILDMNEAVGYAGGACKLWNGSAWADPVKPVDVPFQVWAHRQTTDQMSDILTFGNQFFSTIDIQNASNRSSRQYRDQDQTAKDELENLMKAGNSAQTRFLARVTVDRAVQVYTEPAYAADNALLIDNKGNLMDVTGRPWEPGKLPVGQWVKLTGVPQGVDEFVTMSNEFIERAEWDAVNDRFSVLDFKTAENPFDIVRLA